MAGSNTITDQAQAKSLPGGQSDTDKTRVLVYLINVSDKSFATGKDTDSQTQIEGENKIAIRMKETTGKYFGLEGVTGSNIKSLIKKTAKGVSVIRGARGSKAFTIILKKKATGIKGAPSGVSSFSFPVPQTVGIQEFYDVLDKLPKNKTNIQGFRTPNGRFWSYGN